MQRWWRLYTRSDFRVINVLSGRRKEEEVNWSQYESISSLPRYRLPHSLHSPSLHFDLITRPALSFLSFFLSFLFLPFHQRSSAIPFARFLTSPWFGIFPPCFHSLEKLNSGNCWSAHLAREPSSGHRQTWKTRFSSTRDALLTHRIYTIKNFVLLHTCFPRITRSLSLSISKGNSLSKGGNFIRWFSWMNETCLEQSSGIEYSTSIHPPFHYAFEGEFLRSTKSKKKKRKSHLYGTKTFLFIENIHRTFERLKCSRKMAEKSHLYFINKSR